MTDIVERLRWSGQDAMTKHLSIGMWKLHEEAADEIERLRNLAAIVREQGFEIERLREAHERIIEWSRAYPLSVFSKPDLKRARELLEAGDITLDAISADAMHHVIQEVAKISRAALEPKP